jgi:hypothetical protein
MPILEAQVETKRASRYLVQFCKHAAAMGGGGHTPRIHLHGMMTRREVQVAAEWSDTRGTVTFTPWGQCTLAAETNTLTLRIEAVDEDGLHQIRDVITRDFGRFSRRDPLTVTWRQPETPDASPRREGGGITSTHRRGAVHGSLQTILLVVAVVLVIAVHLGLAGTIAANSRWTGMATNVVLALVVLKVALIALVRFGIRRRKATKTPDET